MARRTYNPNKLLSLLTCPIVYKLATISNPTNIAHVYIKISSVVSSNLKYYSRIKNTTWTWGFQQLKSMSLPMLVWKIKREDDDAHKTADEAEEENNAVRYAA